METGDSDSVVEAYKCICDATGRMCKYDDLILYANKLLEAARNTGDNEAEMKASSLLWSAVEGKLWTEQN